MEKKIYALRRRRQGEWIMQVGENETREREGRGEEERRGASGIQVDGRRGSEIQYIVNP